MFAISELKGSRKGEAAPGPDQAGDVLPTELDLVIPPSRTDVNVSILEKHEKKAQGVVRYGHDCWKKSVSKLHPPKLRSSSASNKKRTPGCGGNSSC